MWLQIVQIEKRDQKHNKAVVMTHLGVSEMKWGNGRIRICQNSQDCGVAWVGRDLRALNLPERMCWQGCVADCKDCELEKAPRAGDAALARAGLCWKFCPAMPGIAHEHSPGRWRLVQLLLGSVLCLLCVLPHLSCQQQSPGDKENLHLAVLSESVGDLWYLPICGSYLSCEILT